MQMWEHKLSCFVFVKFINVIIFLNWFQKQTVNNHCVQQHTIMAILGSLQIEFIFHKILIFFNFH